MTDVALAHVPALVDRVDVVDPDRHPGAVIAAAALVVEAEEDLAVLALHRAEHGRGARLGVPREAPVPAELGEPREALLDARDVQYRDDQLGLHPPQCRETAFSAGRVSGGGCGARLAG